MKPSSLLLLLSISITSFAQKHDYFWIFGYNTTIVDSVWGGSNIDFNYEPPLVYKEDKPMNFNTTMASFCDSSGVLRCYTNGIYIANADHEMMENGDSLNPGFFASSNAAGGYTMVFSEFLLQDPGNPDIYYLFHLKFIEHPDLVLAVSTLYKTTIDISQNGGLGAVLSKNEVVLETDGTFGTLDALKHANGRDWWVVLSDGLKNKYYAFLLTPAGVESPIEQELTPEINEFTNGTIVFSPDGTKMVRYEVPLNKIFIYDFDRCSGTFSNPKVITLWNIALGGGASISQNSRFLYVTSSTRIYQYDLLADNIGFTEKIVAEYDGFADPFSTTYFLAQLGPDGRIYVNCNNGSRYLHVIEQANREGDTCRVIQHGLMLPTRNRFTSPHYPNYRLGPLDGSPCDTISLDNHPLAGWRYEVDTISTLLVSFTDNSFYEPTDWAWDFGDGNNSNEINPVHHYAASGEYEVCLTLSNQYDSDTLCKVVAVDSVLALIEFKELKQLSIHPNPTTGKVALLQAPNGAMVQVYDSLGRLAIAQNLNGKELDLSLLPTGVYWCVVRQEGAVVQAGRVVKQ